ncbi:hypothetical protein F0L68_32135 [Solihabitans fulvus]|uniref:HTH luxR-type domain-containing protein n=1 Tax=Solihabitans fulvus TaxID=1892852 RepID=A0A5B2WSI5_9PSEU|nr:LuxR family transcriptional regulator [Solihabitans fulvus]KAA2253918.1 hypothetical protein F0L68_32135 [Solihabitans fulvus]
MVPDTIDHLMTLGLKKDEAEVYLELLAEGTSTVGALAENTGRHPDSVHSCFEALADAGLVSVVNADRTSVTPIPPGPGLDLLTRRRDLELTQARITAMNAFDVFRRSISGDPAEHLIEVINGPAVVDRIYQLERSAHTEVRGLDSPPYYADADANQVELDNLAGGVRYRVVYAKVALERTEYLAGNVVPAAKSGEEARILPDVPVKLMIIDDDCAVVSLSAGDADANQSALLIRPCSLLSALVGLFEMCWRAALPLSLGAGTEGPYLQPSERRLLGLLAAGIGDDQAARSLGVSRRTLFRHLESLMSRTGAANRFQLALHAMRNGWI